MFILLPILRDDGVTHDGTQAKLSRIEPLQHPKHVSPNEIVKLTKKIG